MTRLSINDIETVVQAIDEMSCTHVDLQSGCGLLWRLEIPNRSDFANDDDFIKSFSEDFLRGFVKAWSLGKDAVRYKSAVELIEKPKPTVSDNIVG